MPILRSSTTTRPDPPRSFALEDCPFETVVVDVTHRCNMACRNCYLPNRTIPDLDRGWLNQCFRRLPPRRFIRLLGGEPTLRDDLPDLVADVRACGHHPVVITNGLRLADRSYVRALKQAGVQIVALSMSGAFDDGLYHTIDGMQCADQKAAAFANLAAEHIYTAVGMIVVRDCNEHAVAPLFAEALRTRNVREMHLRSVGALGRHMVTSPLTLDELLAVFATAADIVPESVDRQERTASSHDFQFGRLRIQLTHWPDLGNWRRGRLTQQGDVAMFFEHVIANEGGY